MEFAGSDQNSFLQEIKTQTRVQHEDIEKVLPFFAADFSLQKYKEFLVGFWSFYFPLEKKILEKIREDEIDFNYEERLKTPELEKDLRALHFKFDTPQATPRDLPEFSTPAELLGALYVVEGSTLGGQIIVAHLRKLGFPEEALHFYTGYGKETGKMWKQFQAELMSSVVTPEQRAEAIASARRTFTSLQNWLGHFSSTQDPH